MMLLLAACGGSGSADASEGSQLTLVSLDEEGSSEPDDAASESSAATVTDGELTFEEAQLSFAACMRDTYPEWPDPDVDAQGGRLGFSPDTLEELGVDADDDDFRDRMRECQDASFQGVARPDRGLTDEQRAELEDDLLALFACVRETPGYEEIPDPDFSGGAPGFGLRELFEEGGVDPGEFRDLMQECQSELGIEGVGGPGGRGPGPGPARG
jgi:hypothetical protein